MFLKNDDDNLKTLLTYLINDIESRFYYILASTLRILLILSRKPKNLGMQHKGKFER
jgi:hypothetical protein